MPVRSSPPSWIFMAILLRPKPVGAWVGMALLRSTATSTGGVTVRRSGGLNFSGQSSNRFES